MLYAKNVAQKKKKTALALRTFLYIGNNACDFHFKHIQAYSNTT